jgi:endonuclease YncB( thermonuclease family)
MLAIDGDTVSFGDGRPNARLVGFDAPEISNPQCQPEADLALQARNRLQAMTNAGTVAIDYLQRSCPPGTPSSECNFGRDCALLSFDGRDIGAILIEEGLAEPFICGPTTCPPRTRSWC